MSGTVSAWTVGLSLGVFVSLYTVLGVVDFYLMRRYARARSRRAARGRGGDGGRAGAGVLR